MLDTRPASILRMALPVMLSSFIQSVISITDAAFLSRYDDLAYDASGSAGLLYITCFMAFVGLADGAQIRIANSVGEKDYKHVGVVFRHAFVNLFVTAILLSIIVFLFAPYILNQFVSSEVLAREELKFLKIRSLAFWADIITMSLQAFFYGTGRTSVMLVSAIIMAVSNVIMGWLFVFGSGPIPSMGLEGAALASTLAEILGMLFLVSMAFRKSYSREYKLLQNWKITSGELLAHLKIGIPLVFQGLIAMSVWTVFFIWIEQMGGYELTVSLNIRYIYFLAFIPIWGFAAATKTYVAQLVGADQFGEIPKVQRRIQLLTVGFLLLTFHGALLYPEALIKMVNTDPHVLHDSAAILRLVSGSILIYGFSSVFFQTVSGVGKTQVTFLIECMSTSCYLITAYLLIKVFRVDITYVWFVEYAYFITMGICAYSYMKWIHKFNSV